MVEITAHCGASHDAPENTRASIELAWRQNADAAEIDIQLSRDRALVVIHDANTRRTTGLDAEVAALTLDELRQLDAGVWKGQTFAGEPIPTLGEIFALIPAGKRLCIEIKNAGDGGPNGIFPPLKAALESSGLVEAQIVLLGFDYELMQTAKHVFPRIAALWLRGWEALTESAGKDVPMLLMESIALCRAAGLDGLNLSYDWLAEVALCHRVRDAGLKLCVHTVNEGNLASRLAQAGVDSITTDQPAWLREQLQLLGS